MEGGKRRGTREGERERENKFGRSPEDGDDEVILFDGKRLRDRDRAARIIDLLPRVLARAKRVAQIDVQQRRLVRASRLVTALPVDREEVVVAEEVRAKELALRGDHEPRRRRQVSSQIAPQRLPPPERLQPLGDRTPGDGEAPERIVNARELGAIGVLQQEGPVDHVAKPLAAERQSREVARAQIRGDLFDQFGREREKRHVSVRWYAAALIAPAQPLEDDKALPAATAEDSVCVYPSGLVPRNPDSSSPDLESPCLDHRYCKSTKKTSDVEAGGYIN